ncbi:MAG: porin family protein, partial [Hyphomicrobium sp.]
MWRRKLTSFGACVLALQTVCAARAQEPKYSWGGFYVGAHLGGALDLTDVADPFGASIYGDTVRAPGPLAGG